MKRRAQRYQAKIATHTEERAGPRMTPPILEQGLPRYLAELAEAADANSRQNQTSRRRCGASPGGATEGLPVFLQRSLRSTCCVTSSGHSIHMHAGTTLADETRGGRVSVRYRLLGFSIHRSRGRWGGVRVGVSAMMAGQIVGFAFSFRQVSSGRRTTSRRTCRVRQIRGREAEQESAVCRLVPSACQVRPVFSGLGVSCATLHSHSGSVA